MGRYISLCFGLLVGWGLWWGSPQPPLSVQPFTVEVAPGQQLAGRLYYPRPAHNPLPAILLCHGVNSSKDTLAPLAQELAHHGIASVVFDFGGYGRSYRRPNSPSANVTDAIALLNWMRQQPHIIDTQRLGILGHSMGGTTALEVAMADTTLRSTVVLSIAGEATPTTPANLLFGSGVYEELNPVNDMIAFFATATGEPTAPNTTVGELAQGTARRLVLSTTVDHALAPYDAQLHRAVIDWAQQSLNIPRESGPFSTIVLSSQRQILGMVLTVSMVMSLLSAGYGHLLHWNDRLPRYGLGGLIIVSLLNLTGFESGIACILLPPFFVANYEHRCRDRTSKVGFNLIKPVLLYGSLAYGLLLLAIFSNAILTGSLIAQPQAIWGFPMLAKTLLVSLPYDRFHLLRYAVHSSLGLKLATIATTTLDLLYPGALLYYGGAIATHSLAFVRQPLEWKPSPLSRNKIALILILFTILIIILLQQQQAGVLTWEAGQLAIRLIGLFVVLPVTVGIGVVRSPWFQHLEQK